MAGPRAWRSGKGAVPDVMCIYQAPCFKLESYVYFFSFKNLFYFIFFQLRLTFKEPVFISDDREMETEQWGWEDASQNFNTARKNRLGGSRLGS